MASQGFMDPDMIIVLAVIAALVFIALALIFHRLKVRVKKGDLDVSIAGDKPDETGAASGAPTAPPSSFDQRGQRVKKQTNIGEGQYNAERDTKHIEESQSPHHNVISQVFITNNNYYSTPRYEDARSDRSYCGPVAPNVVEFTGHPSGEREETNTEGLVSAANKNDFDVSVWNCQAFLIQTQQKVRSGELDAQVALDSLGTMLAAAIANWRGLRQ